MLNESAYALGANRSCIRDLFEYGRQRAAVVGEENVFDYSLGNPSIPSPPEVNETVHAILQDTDSLLVHGYTSAVGDYATPFIKDNSLQNVREEVLSFWNICPILSDDPCHMRNRIPSNRHRMK